MSEQEKNLSQGQNELTNQPNSHKLEKEGEIFMADGTTASPEADPEAHWSVRKRDRMTPQETVEHLDKIAREAGRGDREERPSGRRLASESAYYDEEHAAALLLNSMANVARLKEAGIDVDSGYDFVDAETGVRHKMSSISELLGKAQQSAVESHTSATELISEAKKQLNLHIYTISESNDEAVVKKHVAGFLKEVDKISPLITAFEKSEMEYKGLKYDQMMAKLNDNNTSVEELKGIVEYLSPSMRSRYEAKETKNAPDMPRSLEDLVSLIIQRAEDEYKRGGEFALLEEVKVGDRVIERVNLSHFYEWVRHQTWRVHDNNPTSEANFFTDEGMGVKTSFRTINFYEIVFTPSFFHEKKIQQTDSGVRGDNNSVIGEWTQQNVENPEYEALRQQIYKETFLFMLMRNGDWGYRDNMSGEKGMMQSLEAIYKNNPLTRGNFLETILSMPSMSRVALGEREGGGRKIKEKAEVNFIMGDAIRRAWGAYMHVWDYDMVVKYLGEDSVFFKQQFAEYDEKGKLKPKPKQSIADKDAKEKWFDPGTGLVLSTHRQEYMEFMNLFLGPTPNQGKISEIREKMVLSLMEKEGISYSEAKLAEAWAFSLSNFTGLSARNDTHSVGFQQWTKAQNLEDYRERQMAEQRRAKYGSKYTLRGLKRIALSFMEAALTTDKRALYEVVQGGQGGVVDLENNPIKSYVDYERDYERDKDGFIVFKKHSGRVDRNLAGKAKDYKLTDPDEKGVRKIVFLDTSGNELQTGTSHAIKTEIVLKDEGGARKDGVHATSYEIDKNGKIVFKDRDGKVLETEGLDAEKIYIEAAQKLEFDDQIQRQFIPNHIDMMNQWFRFVIDSEEMDFKGMFLGYNKTTGRPIIDQKKLKEVKEGIRKNITYALSTWPGTDYTKTIRTWERTGSNVVAHDVSILQSMFGSEVLDFIDREAKSSRRKSILTDENIDVYNLAEEHDRLNEDQKKELKLAIWEGVFTYMVSKEIVAHRDWNSNLPRYGLEDAYAVYAVLHDGEVLYNDEASWVKDDSHTKLRWLFAESFGAAAAEGGAKGIFNIFKMMLKDIITS